jgi:dienelactone hydrolase
VFSRFRLERGGGMCWRGVQPGPKLRCAVAYLGHLDADHTKRTHCGVKLRFGPF